MIDKIRTLTINKRIILFVILLMLWFLVVSLFNSDETGYQQGKNTQSTWILSGFYIAGLYAILFPNKRK